ncbi:FUSC family protein, partial [Clostridium sp.]|uniref:FUSC family protein n=1 Tax=Clostridium sp. TaxID=1506 RepID=UPI003F2A9CA4
SRTANYSGDRDIKINFLNYIKSILSSIKGYSLKENSLDDVKDKINKFISEYEDKVEKSKVIEESVYVFKIFILSINNSKEYNESILNEIYTEINIPKKNNLIEKLKEEFTLESLRARYSLKLATTMAVSIFLVSFLNLKHSSWIILSIYVVLQPYSEDSIKKAKERFNGVLFGVTIYFGIFSIIKDSIPKTVIILIAFTLYFYYTEYNKKVIMTTIVSLSSISLVTGIGMLSFDRFILVVLGVCIALIFNKYLLPYDIEDSIKELKSKYVSCTNIIVKELEDLKKGKGDLLNVIHNSMIKDQIESKLIQNENKINNKEIEKLIFNESVIAGEVRYEFLKFYYLNFYNKDVR